MDHHTFNVQKKSLPRIVKLVSYVVLVVLVFVGGIALGYSKRPSIEKITSIENKNAPKDLADFEPFWKVWNLINEKYPNADKISNQDRVWGAIQGLVASTKDPYTTFFPPEESKQFNDEITGSFTGIGVEIGVKDKLLTVIAPLKNTPAARAGLKSGDKILKIDGTVAGDISTEKAISLIRGEKGTPVKLTIYRDSESEPIEISIIRDTITIPTVESKIQGDTYIISFYSFSANSAQLMDDELNTFNKSGLKKLILDVRGNPGGFLDSAVDIASEFLPQGTPIVTEDFSQKEKSNTIRSKGYGTIANDVKVVVLIDGGSASASEILAGALHDAKRATLIGERSFGKGSVQELIPVTDDTSVKITIAKWLTPNGVSISEKGITPDIVVPISTSDVRAKKDPQLDRALTFLAQGK